MTFRHVAAFLALMLCIGMAPSALAQGAGGGAGRLDATIWVDPDGCEHWVMDTGFEGFMSPRLNRDGTPRCLNRDRFRCNKVGTAALFEVDSAELSKDARARLTAFFIKEIGGGKTKFLVDGHTDNTASTEHNLALSKQRAEAVAGIVRSLGATAQARGFGELSPVASNSNEAGRCLNRRVEIFCE
ncbi:MAG: OmpA family protein [Paracoccaceae bacterium]